MATSRPSIIRLPSLTGYRAVLFLAVYLTHALGAARFFRSNYADNLGTIAPYGTAALSSFFVLSGFVLTWQEPWRGRTRSYLRRRLLKIYPGHIVVWAATLIVLAVVGPMALIGTTRTGPAITNLFLVQAWVPKPSYLMSVYGINWSVSCEMLFYLSLPLVVRPLLRIPANRLWACFAGLSAVLLVIPEVLLHTIHESPWMFWAPLSFHQAWLVYFFPLSRLPEFLLGVVLARIVQTGQWPRIRAWWVMILTVLVWRVSKELPAIYLSSGLMAIPVSLFIPLLALRDIGGRARWLNHKAVVTLGEASYAAYLVHFPVLALSKHLIGDTEQFGIGRGILIVAGVFTVNELLGLALWKYLEKPVMRRFSRSAVERAAPQTPPAVTPEGGATARPAVGG